MQLTSPAFRDGEPIPKRYTCQGDDASPPLEIDNPPTETASLALIMDDPDAPGGTFTHWLIWNLPPTLKLLPEGLPRDEQVEGLGAAEQGRNDFGEIGYRGPCPPPGRPHTYRFHLYALRMPLTLDPGVDRGRLEEAMRGQVAAEAQLTGTFGR